MRALWPFRDPPNVAVFTLKRIVAGGSPILLVKHDSDDGAWQFLDGDVIAERDAAVVSLQSVVLHDNTLAQLADLPVGWVAWRDTPAAPWERSSAAQ